MRLDLKCLFDLTEGARKPSDILCVFNYIYKYIDLPSIERTNGSYR